MTTLPLENANRKIARGLQYIALLAFLLFLAFPIYFMVITSLKTSGEAYRIPPTLWPQHPTLDDFPFLWKAWDYWRTLFNTIVIAGVSSGAATFLGGIAAYGFSRLRFWGKTVLYGFMVGSIAVPAMVTVGPIFLAYKQFHLLDTYFGMMLVYAADGLPLAFLILFSYFKVIPPELDDAAAIDGANMLNTFFRIIFPIAFPGFVVTFLLLFIGIWNEFLFAFTLTITPNVRMLTVRLFAVPVRADVNVISYDLIAAGGVLILLPLIPLLLRVRKQLVDGILAGAIK
jgi:ABC-type glycerol-3-phosphate transport system permease component